MTKQKMEKTIPMTLQWDENFDVGADTGTPVDDRDEPAAAVDQFLEYFRCPLRFGVPVASMTFPAEILDRPLPASNRLLKKSL